MTWVNVMSMSQAVNAPTASNTTKVQKESPSPSVGHDSNLTYEKPMLSKDKITFSKDKK